MRTNSIDLVWIVVKDFKNAVKFYTEVAGLKVVEMKEEWGWAELQGHQGKGMRLGIAQQRPYSQDPIQPGQNSIVTFNVDNIEQANKDLIKQGANLVGEVIEVPGHVKLQTVRDAEGNFFQLVEVCSANACGTHEKKSSCCAH